MIVDVKKMKFKNSFKKDCQYLFDELNNIEKDIKKYEGRLKRAIDFEDDTDTVKYLEHKVLYEIYKKKKQEAHIINTYLNYLRG